MVYPLLRFLLFFLPAERAHHFTMGMLVRAHRFAFLRGIIRSRFMDNHADDVTNCFGLEFPNRIGMAAGFDKDGEYMHELASLGFGFLEVGTVTPVAQDGNPQPRLFRLKKDRALINRMGFNNKGLEHLVERLKDRPKDIIIGANIGKNKITPNEKATDDYLKCFHALHPYVDYFVVNVSSPNTPGLRELQEREPLTRLLSTLRESDQSKAISRPILLKIAPDLNEGQLDDIVDIVAECGIDGIIATNTTIDRSSLRTDAQVVEEIGAGGLSGDPLRTRANQVMRYIHERAAGRFELVGVGGIRDAQAAVERIQSGASLIQVYSGFVYEGPGMVKRLLTGIRKSDIKQSNSASTESV